MIPDPRRPAIAACLLAVLLSATAPTGVSAWFQTTPYRTVAVTTHVERAREVVMSPDGLYLAVLGEPDADGNDGLSIVDLGSLEEVFYWRGGARRLAFFDGGWAMLRSPDDVWVAPMDDNLGNLDGDGFLFSAMDVPGTADGTDWSDLDVGAEVMALVGTAGNGGRLVALTQADGRTPEALSLEGSPVSVDLSPDGRRAVIAATGTADAARVGIWDLTTRSVVADLRGLEGTARTVAFSPDGGLVAAAGDQVLVWDAATGAETSRWNPDRGPASLAWGDRFLAVADRSGKLTFFEPHEGREIFDLHTRVPVRSLAVDREGSVLAAAGTDGELIVLVHESRMPTAEKGVEEAAHAPARPTPASIDSTPLPEPMSLDDFTAGGSVSFAEAFGPVAMDPAGRLAVVGMGKSIALLDLEAGTDSGRWTPPGAEQVTALDVAPDGATVAAAVAAGVVTILNVPDGGVVRTLDVTQGRNLVTARDLAISPSGEVLAVPADNELVFFDLRTGEPIARVEAAPPGNLILHVAWSPDGTMLASTGVDRKIRLWPTGDLSALSPDRARCVIDLGQAGTSLHFAPAGSALVMADYDGAVHSWNAESCEPRASFPVNAGFLRRIAVSPDGTLVLAGGEDGAVRALSTEDGSVAGTLQAPTGSNAILLDHSGRTLLAVASGDGGTEVTLWKR